MDLLCWTAREGARVQVLMTDAMFPARNVPRTRRLQPAKRFGVTYDRRYTWIRSSAMAGKTRHPRTGRQRYIAYRLISTAPHPANQENVALKTFHSCQPRPPTIIQKAGCKAAPKQRPPGGPKNKTAKEYYFTQKKRLPKRTQKWGRRAVPFL